MNPRKMSGFGLTDGEQMQRLWAYLPLFSKIPKEQTPVHRKQLLTMALFYYAERKSNAMCKKPKKIKTSTIFMTSIIFMVFKQP